MTQPEAQASDALSRIVESARRLGVEVDEADALQWLAAVSAGQADGSDVVVDAREGVFGHRVTMLDFSTADLAHFRRIGKIVEIQDAADVKTALAISGSSAQSKVQSYPGDCDYFERVNIEAPTREAATHRLAEIMREKMLSTFKGADYQFVYCHWGTAHEDLIKCGQLYKKGASLTWDAAEVKAGEFEAILPAGKGETEGRRVTIPWSHGESDPGWCKMDWVVADLPRGQLASASNVLDVTWEAPDGSIAPLDGFIDPYFQEVYLDAASIPVFTKLVKQISGDALDDYVDQLRGEVRKWAYQKPNYGKVAKRLYNIFRLTGHYAEAAYIRELFDEPTALLYQVWSLLSTIENLGAEGSPIDIPTVQHQMDSLIKNVIDTCEGPLESQIVIGLLQLKDNIAGRSKLGERYVGVVSDSQHAVMELVNLYFRERLYALPEVADYLEALRQEQA